MAIRSCRPAPAAILALLGAGACGPRDDAPGPRPVVVVAVDTLRADHLGAWGYGRPTSPSIDRLAAEGVLFEQAYSQANETMLAFASLFTSRLASELAPLDYNQFALADSVETLPGILRMYGYRTGGFVAGGNLAHNFGFHHGFDVYQDQWDFGSFFHTVPPALRWLDGLDAGEPFFLFVHGYDPHAMYLKPLVFENLFDPDYEGVATRLLERNLAVEKIWNGRYFAGIAEPDMLLHRGDQAVLDTDIFSMLAAQDPAVGVPLDPADLDHVVAHYDGCVAYGDFQVGLLLGALEERGVLDEALVVLLGDHGEDLFEHGHVNHRITLHDASTHVPLIVRFPDGAAAGTRVTEMVELVDVLPTVFDWLDIPPPAYARGRSLLPLARGTGETPPREGRTVSEGVLAMGSLRTPTHRLVVGGAVPGTPEFQAILEPEAGLDAGVALFGLDEGTETRLDLAADPEAAALARDLLGDLARHYAEGHPVAGGVPPRIDPALREAMIKNGYW